MKYSIIILVLLMLGCSSPTENQSKYDAPADHTVKKSGAMHKPGLSNPAENCAACHGDDLRGDTVGVSCYECHGKKW
jgi:cytochrome c553